MKVIGAYSPFVQSACAVIFKSPVWSGDRHSLLGKDMNVDELITTIPFFFPPLFLSPVTGEHFSVITHGNSQTQTDARRHQVKRLQLIFEPSSESIAENQWDTSSREETTPCWVTGLGGGGGGGGGCLLSTLYRALFLHKHTYNTDTEGRHRCAPCIQRNRGQCVWQRRGRTLRPHRGKATQTHAAFHWLIWGQALSVQYSEQIYCCVSQL